NVIRFFHDPVIDRDAAALSICIRDEILLSRGAEELLSLIECVEDVRQMPYVRLKYRACLPDEYPAVPVKVTALDKYLRQCQLRLFGESLDLMKTRIATDGLHRIGLDIAVTGLRTVRFYAKSE